MLKNNKQEVAGIIRHVATALGAICITKGLMDENAVAELTGAATTLVALIWSLVEKKQSKKK